MSDKPTTRVTPGLVLGVMVMAAGLLLTLDNFGLLEARRFVRFWPVVLIVLGLSQLLQQQEGRSRSQGYLLALLGMAFLSVNLDLLMPRQALALFLLGLGAILVWRATTKAAPGLGGDPARNVELLAFMGAAQRVLSAQDFRGGNATAIMGGVEIDLRKASIQGEAAVIDTFALFGGIDIKVPMEWAVEMQGVALLGGYGDSTRRPDDERKKLIITGFLLMGGVEVHN